MKGRTIVNGHIIFKRIMLISCCIILPLAPFIVAYLILDRPDSFDGCVMNKRRRTVFKSPHSIYDLFIGTTYYLIVGAKELKVSNRIYKMLSIGDYVSVAYRKDTLYYYTKLN